MRRSYIGVALAVATAMTALPTWAADDDIVIGAPMALTGTWAFIGVAVNKGIEIAVDQANAEGGVNGRKIRLVVDDTASEKAQTVTVVNRMIVRDEVLGILGPATTIEVTAVGPLVNEKSVPLITSSPTAAVRDFGPWSFNTTTPPSNMIAELAKNSFEMLGIKKVATVTVRENEGFVIQKNYVHDAWKAMGVEVVSDESISQTDTDFTALATKLADMDIDTLSLYAPPELGANVVIQARQAGMSGDVRIVVPPGLVNEAYQRTGGSAVEGTIAIADYSLGGGDRALNEKFTTDFNAKFGHQPDNWAGVGYTAANIMLAAAEASGSDVTRDSIRENIGKTSGMPTVLGTGVYSLGPDRTPSYGSAMLRIENGVWVTAK